MPDRTGADNKPSGAGSQGVQHQDWLVHSERLGESCGRSMALLADVLVVIHLLYILFVVGGGGAIIAEQAGAFGEPARDPRERVITVAW